MSERRMLDEAIRRLANAKALTSSYEVSATEFYRMDHAGMQERIRRGLASSLAGHLTDYLEFGETIHRRDASSEMVFRFNTEFVVMSREDVSFLSAILRDLVVLQGGSKYDYERPNFGNNVEGAQQMVEAVAEVDRELDTLATGEKS